MASSKQEILDNYLDGWGCSRMHGYIDADGGIYDTIEGAMEEYAKQQSIDFKEWCAEHIYYPADPLVKYERLSQDEIYDLYLKSKSQQSS